MKAGVVVDRGHDATVFDRCGPAISEQRAELFFRLSERRAAFEHAVVADHVGALGPADAEDIVSAGLERVLTAKRLPIAEAEHAWFGRVLSNLAIDEIRRERGRRQGSKRGALRQMVLLSELEEYGFELQDEDELLDPANIVEQASDDEAREEMAETARAALYGLDPLDARLLFIRHVELPDANRSRCAEEAGLTVDAWRHRYGRAWNRFVELVAATESSARCGEIRQLVGALDTGELKNGAAKAARGQVDAHVVECTACRVFARESYRILIYAPPVVPAVPLLQRVIDHTAGIGERNADTIAVGGAAAGGGIGLLSWLFGSGGLSVALKTLVVLCGVSATVGGICGGVIATKRLLDHDKAPPHKARPVVASRPTPTPEPQGPEPTPPAVAPRSTPRLHLAAVRSVGTGAAPTPTAAPRNQGQPAAVPSSAPGREFVPVASNAQSDPAPVAAGGGGEFTP